MLGIPLGTIQSRLFRALRTMRAALEADDRSPTAGGRAGMGSDRFDLDVAAWLESEGRVMAPNWLHEARWRGRSRPLSGLAGA